LSRAIEAASVASRDAANADERVIQLRAAAAEATEQLVLANNNLLASQEKAMAASNNAAEAQIRNTAATIGSADAQRGAAVASVPPPVAPPISTVYTTAIPSTEELAAAEKELDIATKQVALSTERAEQTIRVWGAGSTFAAEQTAKLVRITERLTEAQSQLNTIQAARTTVASVPPPLPPPPPPQIYGTASPSIEELVASKQRLAIATKEEEGAEEKLRNTFFTVSGSEKSLVALNDEVTTATNRKIAAQAEYDRMLTASLSQASIPASAYTPPSFETATSSANDLTAAQERVANATVKANETFAALNAAMSEFGSKAKLSEEEASKLASLTKADADAYNELAIAKERAAAIVVAQAPLSTTVGTASTSGAETGADEANATSKTTLAAARDVDSAATDVETASTTSSTSAIEENTVATTASTTASTSAAEAIDRYTVSVGKGVVLSQGLAD